MNSTGFLKAQAPLSGAPTERDMRALKMCARKSMRQCGRTEVLTSLSEREFFYYYNIEKKAGQRRMFGPNFP